MIRNQWYAILESSEVKAGQVVGVTRMGEKLALWRNSRGELACMADLCPHRGVALSAGKVLHDNVQCPFHGFEFDASGRCTVIPANGKNARAPKAFQASQRPVDQRAIAAANGVVVDKGQMHSSELILNGARIVSGPMIT